MDEPTNSIYLTGFDLKNALIADGALFVHDNSDVPPEKPGMRLIAVAISPKDENHESDFHFYRLDGGIWTHKPGKGLVTNVDAVGLPIKNPALANRDYRQVLINEFHWPYNYKYFVGFFYFPVKKSDCTKKPSNKTPVPFHDIVKPQNSVR